MKKILLTTLLFSIATIVVAQKKTAPPALGHYKKLSALDGTAKKGMEIIDTLRFILEAGDTRVEHIERNISGPNTTSKAPESKCDPAACQPGELIGKGRKRAPYYLSASTKFSIPDPPANSSDQTRAELDYLLQLQRNRTDEDIRSSQYYAGVFYNTTAPSTDKNYKKLRKNLFHIGRSIAPWFNADSLPITATLIANVWMDAEYVIWKYKNYFMRIRPYKLEPALKNVEETNWAAYPSGHSTNSYVNAYLFSALMPEFSSFFVKDAYDMAHSREILGVHYPSDSESGRVLAYELVQTLLANEKFKEDFKKAKEEINKKIK